jgi:hypothetical protein
MNALAFALTFIDRLPGLIAAGANIIALIQEHKAQQDVFSKEGRDPTPAEWDALNKRLDDLEKQLQT